MNGHRNWSQWNVSLWMNNDEKLYNMAAQWVGCTSNKGEAADGLLQDLRDMGVEETPDGAKYSYTSIRAALTGF